MINNNKGFAFSTMLYGLLAVMMLLLLLIFNLYKNTSDEIYYYSQSADEKLYECAATEIALENCYATSNDCGKKAEAYYGCLGINKEDDTPHLNLFEKLSATTVTTGNGLYKLSDDSYVYRGSAVNNIVKYSDRLWRIISFTKSGLAKIMEMDVSSNANLKSVAWDTSNDKEWEDSSLYAYLQGNYYSSLSSKDLLEKVTWYVGRPNVDDPTTLDSLREREKGAPSIKILNVGLLNTSDYAQASLNTVCQTSPLTSDNCNINNYLNEYKTWTLNSSNGNNNDAFILNGSRISEQEVSATYEARPVVYLSNRAVIIKGDGTSSNPYVIG